VTKIGSDRVATFAEPLQSKPTISILASRFSQSTQNTPTARKGTAGTEGFLRNVSGKALAADG
jgi:hypothetical protein